MSQQIKAAKDTKENFKQWCFQETVKLERKKQEFGEEKRTLDEEKRFLELEKSEFKRRKETENQRLKQQEKILNIKWHILEEELRKLASDKEQVERQKQFYESVSDYEKKSYTTSSIKGNVVKGELFFKGVANELALKKRYKDLIKIYHPDNLDGDTCTIQEINREYERLKRVF